MKKIKKSSLLLAAKVALGNSIKRFALVCISIIALSSTISATQYCSQTLTSGAYNVSVSMSSPSSNIYVLKVVSSTIMEGVYDGTWVTVNGSTNQQVNSEPSIIKTLSSDQKTLTITLNSTTVPVFYQGLQITFSGVGRVFTLPSDITWGTCVPTLGTTTAASAITGNTASSGGNVLDVGSSDLTARGVCWSTTTGPTVDLSTKTSDAIGTGTGTFTSGLTSLSLGTTYYVRSYATNSSGTGYGTEVSFTTLSIIPASPIPTATSVISLYSNAYTPATTVTFASWWNMVLSPYTLADGGNAQQMVSTATGSCGGANSFTSPATLDVSGKTYLHVDIYPTSTMTVGVKLVTATHGQTTGFLSLGTLTTNQWNSKDILLSSLGTTGLTDLNQVGFETTGCTGTFYMDNLYFYTPTVPDAPTIVTAVATGVSGTATVSFTAPAYNGGAVITSYTATSSPGGITSTLTQSGSGTFTFTGLTNGTAYTFTVKANNIIGSSVASAASNSVTPATTPGAPTIGVITPGNGQLSVAFTAGSTGGSAITNYKYSTNGGSTFTACSPTQTTGPVVITGLANGTSYNIQLKAVNIYGDGTATSSTAATPCTVPGAPTSVTAAVSGISGAATVTFTAPVSNGGSAITSYTATSSPGGITSILYQSGGGTFNFTGLTNGTAYTFTVTATNAAGTGPASTASGSVTPYVIPASPTPTATSVISLYSNAYTPAVTTTYRTWWDMVLTDYILADGGNAKKMVSTASGNCAGAPDAFTTPSTLDVSGKTYLHVDVYPTTAFTIDVCLVAGSASSYVSLGTLTANQWNSIDLALTSYTGFTTALKQVGFRTPSGAGTFYMDNLYFYTPTAPNAPTIGTATAGIAQATVTFTPPAYNGGSPITGYTVTSSPGGIIATGTTSPIVITGLTNNTAYTFTVKATNAFDTSVASAASNSVTPGIPASPTPSYSDCNVKSIYSDTYTPATTVASWTGWRDCTITAATLADGGNAKKFDASSIMADGGTSLFASPSTLDVSTMTYLHIDIYPTTATSVTVALVIGASVTSSLISLGTLTANQWNSKDIALTNYKTPPTDCTTAVDQIRIDVPSSGTFYMDNLYFYKLTPCAPTITAITPGNGQLSVAFTAGNAGGSAITNYIYSTDGGSTFTACSPAQTTGPIIITTLANGTTYNVQLKAVNSYGDGTATSSTAGTPRTVPGTPTIGTAAVSGISGTATVSFTAPASNGGSTILSYTATSSPGNITGTLTQAGSGTITVSGLTNGTAYTFTVTATNAAGPGAASSASNSVTPYTVPDAPTIGIATATGNTQATVTFTPPASNGGSPITYYTVTSSTGSFTATGTTSPIVISGLTNGTAYTFTVTATNAAGTSLPSSPSNSLTPAPTSVTISTTEPLSPYYPSSITDVTVTSTGVLTVDATVTVKSITAYPGAQITLATGKTLTVVGAFILQSDATGAATFLDNGTLTAGSASVQQYLPSGRNWYISSPVSAATSSTFNALNYTSNKLYWDDEAHGSTVLWPQIINNTTPLDVLRGYIANLAATTTVTFSGGTLNTGEKSITVYRTVGQYKEGFNLVGNPYPSYLDWDQISNTSFFTTMWYRSKNADNYYVFDTYNADGQLGTGNNGVTVNNHIPPMQAFWVQVKDGLTQGTLTVNNSMRSHKGSQGLVPDGIFKTKATQPVKQSVLRLKVSTGNNTDEAIIYSNTNASNGFDMYDSPKMFAGSTSLAEIFTLAGNQQLVINGLNNLPYGSEIPLGFTTSRLGTATYSLKASEFSNFEAGTHIILKDYKDVNYPVVTDLSDGGVYTFTSTPSSYNTTRFTLIFKAPSSVTGINPVDNGDVWISTNGHNQLIINGILNNGSFVEVFNTIGQKIVSMNSSATNNLSGLLPGVYLVTITQNAKKITQKIILN